MKFPAIALAFAALAAAQETPIAFTGGRVLPISGPEIADGVLVVHRGRITAVGAAGTAVPANSTRVDARGKVLMPGLVDTHSHVGGIEGADSSAPIQADVRILDSINVRDARIQKAQAGGITVANVMPGSGHLLSGQTLYLKLRDGKTVDDLVIRLEDGSIAGGIKMANGTNSRRASPFPGTRSTSARHVRPRATLPSFPLAIWRWRRSARCSMGNGSSTFTRTATTTS
jgi:imidazolonepropionase-like amidohydrolase